MPVLKKILAGINLQQTDGRPLYAVPLTEETHTELRLLVKKYLNENKIFDRTAGCFVLWAAEYIRAYFQGGPLTWKFIFDGLGCPENQKLGIELVKRGLRWWRREVRTSEAGSHLYLYSLMAEGGLPQALLLQQSLYGRVIRGLIADIEAEGTGIPEDLAYRIAGRWVADLPQTFHSHDIVRLLVDLGLALVKLRAEPPKDVPQEILDRWLDQNHPDWAGKLPLRLSKEIADNLIRPALRAERKSVPSSRMIARRSLIWNERTGEWNSVVQLTSDGILPSRVLPPTAKGLRLRFLVTNNIGDETNSIIYSATPIEDGWELYRIGRASTISPLDLDKPLVLSGYADGRPIGEVEIVPSLPLPDEMPSFWGEEQNGKPSRLFPLGERVKTRSPQIWLLIDSATKPICDNGVVCGEPYITSHGRLWPLQGSGTIRIAEKYWHIETATNEEYVSINIIPRGEVLSGWRLAKTGGKIFLGKPTLYGQRDTNSFRQLSEKELQRRPARLFRAEIAEWIENNTVISCLHYVTLPQKTTLKLRETSVGVLELLAEGFPDSLFLTLKAGDEREYARLNSSSARITLAVKGAPPGMVELELTSQTNQRKLELIAPWPARNGMLLRPDGTRLEQDMPLSIDGLRGWRAVMPKNDWGEIELRTEDLYFAMRIQGETSLVAYTPLIHSMLAHTGPDSEVKLNLITNGMASRRLKVRRYHHQSNITADGKLRLGLSYDNRTNKENAFSDITTRGEVVLHAIDLKNPERIVSHELETQGEIDLQALLPEGEALWLIQSSLNGQVQRAAVWSPDPPPPSTREQRIEKYKTIWHELTIKGNRREWQQQWKLIRATMTGGDAGILDQVQALAYVPSAAIRLILNTPQEELAQALELDLAAPIFWPAFPITAFVDALSFEHDCLVKQYKEIMGNEQEAKQEAVAFLAKRIEHILLQNPALAGHFGAALSKTGLLADIPENFLSKIAVPPNENKLTELAQEAARRHDLLPDGIKKITALYRPGNLPVFNSYVQKLIDTPLVTAEIATGLRKDLNNPATLLTLINLRIVDPHYFDAALPVAIALALQRVPS